MKNEQKSSVGALIFAVILIAGIVALYVGTHIDLLFHEPKDLMELMDEEGEPVKGEYVSIGVDAVVDCYAETKHRINGIIPAGTDTHYLLWLDDGSFISLQAKGKKDIQKLNKIMRETQNYLYGATESLPEKYEITGVISTMDSEIEDYYQDCLSYWEINSMEGAQIYYVQIDETQTKLSAWLITGFFVIIEIIAIVSLIKAIQEKKQEKLAAQAVAMTAPITDENNNLYS